MVDWNLPAYDPNAAFNQGSNYVNKLYDTQAQRQAGSKIATGDLRGAAADLGGRGDIEGALAVTGAAQTRENATADRQAATFQKQHDYLQRAVPVLTGILQKGGPQALGQAFDQLAPELQAIGTPPEQIDKLRQGFATDPEQTLKILGATAARKFTQVKVGEDTVFVDEANPSVEVARFKGSRAPPAGFETGPVGADGSPSLVPIKGGPADPELKKQEALDRRTVIVNNPTLPAGGSGGGSADTSNPNVQNWTMAVTNGNATMQQVPAALRNGVAASLAEAPQTAYSPLASSRFSNAANRILQNYIKLPAYQLTANGKPYLQRIDAALKVPGSVSDQDLLDSLTKLNTAGNAITDAQVRIITDGKSFADMAATFGNKFKNGGVLSDNQRKQIHDIAQGIFANYQKGYQPLYNKATAQLRQAGIPEAFWSLPDLNKLSAEEDAITAADSTQTRIPFAPGKGPAAAPSKIIDFNDLPRK